MTTRARQGITISISITAALLSATFGNLVTHQNPAAAATSTIRTEADAYVNAASPGTNYGSATQLSIDGSPKQNTYLRFSLPAGSITKATLRLYASGSSPRAIAVHPVSNSSWVESQITYGTAPAMDAAMVSLSRLKSGWNPIDVTSLITQSSLQTLGVDRTHSDQLLLSSKEGTNAPELVVEFVPPPPPVTDPRGMWVWDEATVTDATKRTQLLDFATAHSVRHLYVYSQTLLYSDPTNLTAFVEAAAARTIAVELLFGDPEWARTANHDVALGYARDAATYAAGLTGTKPTAVHFDVEPHVLADWATNQTTLSQQYVDLLEELRVAKGPDLKLTGDFALCYATFSITRGGVTKELTKWVLDNLDTGVLMDYRDFALGLDSITYHATLPVDYAGSIGKPVRLGVETTCNLDPPKVSFCEEGNYYMETELGKVLNNYLTTPGFGGLSIHHYGSYKTLQP